MKIFGRVFLIIFFLTATNKLICMQDEKKDYVDIELGMPQSFYNEKERRIFGLCSFINKITGQEITNTQLIEVMNKIAMSMEEYTKNTAEDVSDVKLLNKVSIASMGCGIIISIISLIISFYK